MMRKISLIVVLLGFLASVAFAQTPPTAPSQSQTFSEQDKAAAKRELEKVGELFGVQKQAEPSTTAQTAATTDDQTKTIADVADKALDMVGNAVGTIAGAVEKVAPEVWEIMVRQQFAVALSMLVGPFSFLMLIIFYVVIAKKYWKKPANYEEVSYFEGDHPNEKFTRAFLTTLVPGVLGIIFAGVLAYRVGDALPMLINPKYYAVRDLFTMLLK